MEVRQIIVIGGSAGSFEPLKLILSSLSENLDASIFIVIHTSGEREHTLDKVLGRSSLLPVRNAQDDEPFQKGVYLAPSDRHLTISASGVTRVARGPKENRFRPAIDPLFRSAAIAFGPSVTGVILSGALDDGSAGLWAIKSQGGTTIVQNPEDAVIPFMPLNAIKNVQPHHCVPAQEIASLLISGGASRLAGRLNHSAYHKTMETEIKIAQGADPWESGVLEWGKPSTLACPECHGTLMEMAEGPMLRFRCHTGHGYSLETLIAELSTKTEESLWNTIRCFEETILLSRRMAGVLSAHGHVQSSGPLLARASAAQAGADMLRKVLGVYGPAELVP